MELTPISPAGMEEVAKAEHSSIRGACVAIVRCMVGPAALYMPHGFAEGGLVGALIIVLVANLLFFAGISRLLLCWRVKAGTREARDTAELAQALGGPWCRRLVRFSVVCLQAGVCVTYFIFVAETLRDVWRRASHTAPPPTTAIMAVMLAVEAPSATVRRIQKLEFANTLGNVLVAVSLAIIFAYSMRQLVVHGPADDWRRFTTPSNSIVFAGTAIFAFEGAASILVPAANSVAPSDRDRIATATFGCVVGVATCYCVFATTVYLAYGSGVRVIASRVLDDESGFWPDGVINGAYLLVALLSFPLQLLPACQILFGDDDATAQQKDYQPAPPAEDDDRVALVRDDAPTRLKGDVQRVALVAILGAVALVGRHSLDHVISLLGALSCAPLALVVGPWCHLSIAKTTRDIFLDKLIIAAGILVTLLTLALTLASWRDAQS